DEDQYGDGHQPTAHLAADLRALPRAVGCPGRPRLAGARPQQIQHRTCPRVWSYAGGRGSARATRAGCLSPSRLPLYGHYPRPDVSAQAAHAGPMNVFPFERSGDLMTVTARVWGPDGDRELLLVIDTGAAATSIEPAVLDGLGYSSQDA